MYLIRQRERDKVSFVGARNVLGLQIGNRYTLTLLKGDKPFIIKENAKLGKQYLSGWTRMYDDTGGKPLIAYRMPHDEIRFELANSNNPKTEYAIFREILAHRTGIPIDDQQEHAFIENSSDELFKKVKSQLIDLGLEDVTKEPLKDKEVLIQLKLPGFLDISFRGDSEEIISKIVQRGRLQIYFRKMMFYLFNGKCAFCGCTLTSALEAAHILPWNHCDNDLERIDGGNGLLLCATHHRLFDAGEISISNNFVLSTDAATGEGMEALNGIQGRKIPIRDYMADAMREYIKRKNLMIRQTAM